MTPPHVRLVDWRQQFGALDSYLSERGGVIQVAATDAAPSSTFSKIVRHRMDKEPWPRTWTSVQIDGSNPSTHYAEDIVLQLERSLGIVGPPISQSGSGAIAIGTDIQAETVEIANVSLAYDEDELSRRSRALARADRIGEHIRANASTHRLALLFLNSHRHERNALRRFRGLLWDRVLHDLTEVGLLVIDIDDPNVRAGDEWPPEANLILTLPERFEGSAQVDAQEDLAGIALTEGVVSSDAEARVFASTLLAACNDARELHARLANALTRLGSP